MLSAKLRPKISSCSREITAAEAVICQPRPCKVSHSCNDRDRASKFKTNRIKHKYSPRKQAKHLIRRCLLKPQDWISIEIWIYLSQGQFHLVSLRRSTKTNKLLSLKVIVNKGPTRRVRHLEILFRM